MRQYIVTVLVFFLVSHAFAQEATWIAPEGKIINDRTLVWGDFLGKPSKDEDPRAGAAVRPAIYAYADGAEVLPNDKVKIKFRVKCAFQSAAWVKEAVEKEHTYYYLNHEQHHYDIALLFANKLQTDLSVKEFSQKNYEKEIESIYFPLLKKYQKTQEDYDNESNHSLIVEKQVLWDMRIKKCLENNTDEFFESPADVVKTVWYLGQNVKRLPGEPVKQFTTRCRPLYCEFSDDLAVKTIETTAWTEDKAIVAFYRQNFNVEIEDEQPKECTRLLGEVFVTTDRSIYKRALLDTFANGAHPTKITSVFFANADSDAVKELIVISASDIKNTDSVGTLFSVRVFDKTFAKLLPARIKRLESAGVLLSGGFEGVVNGKPVKAKHKNQKEVEDELKKAGFVQ